MGARRTLGLACVVAALSFVVTVTSSASVRLGVPRALGGSVSRLLSVSHRLGAVPAGEKIVLTLPLALPHQNALNTYANDEYAAGNRNFHHFLRPAQFGRMFGAPSAEVTQAEAALRTLGLTVASPSVNHLYLTATASVGTAERVFGTKLDLFTLGGHALLSGREFYANVSAITLPTSLRGLVTSVIGMNDAVAPRPLLGGAPVHGAPGVHLPAGVRPHIGTEQGVSGGATPCPAAIAGAGYTAPDLATAYDFNGLYADGDHGEGMSAALVEFSDYHDSNVAAVESCYGVTTPVIRRNVDGGNGGTPGVAEAEDMADIGTILEMDPDLAHLYVYVAPSSELGSETDEGNAELDLYSAFVTDDLAPVISSSWGDCEDLQSQGYADLYATIAEEAAVQGQNIFDASGDSGAVDCEEYPGPITGSISAEMESSVPWVIGVGGTDLGEESTVAASGIHDEDTWNDAGAGGGGQSFVWSMPAWQQAYLTATGDTPAGQLNQCGADGTSPCRMVPDISLDGDPDEGMQTTTQTQFTTDVGSPGYSIYCGTTDCTLPAEAGAGLPIGIAGPAGGAGGWYPIGGTSLATPLAASAAVLWDEQAKKAGLSGIGFLTPSFYRIASNAKSYASDFHDITTDSNDDQYDSSDCPTGCNPKHLYAAGTGYDMASGLGSVDVANLGGDLVKDATAVDLTPSDEAMYGYVNGPAGSAPVSVTSGLFGSTFTATSSAGWLAVTSTGRIPGSLQWHVDPTGLAAGAYTGTITVTGKSGATSTLTVKYAVTPRATMSLSESSIAFNEPAIDSKGAATTATCGNTVWNDELKDDGLNSPSDDTAAVAPTSLNTLGISNTGPAGSVLHWEATFVSPTSGWLSTDLNPNGNATGFQTEPTPLVPTGGAVASGSTDELKLASLGNESALAGYASMNQGTYQGIVQVRDMADHSVLDTIPVTLVLGTGQGTPTIAAAPAAISLTLAPGASKTVNVVLSDSSGICGYAYSMSTSASWVEVNPYLLSGNVAATPATAAPSSPSDTGSGNGDTPITISTTGLAPGTYTTNVTINSQNANPNPTNVLITLTIPGTTPTPTPRPSPKPNLKPCLVPGDRITLAQHPHRPVREITAVLSINGKVVSRLHAHAIRKVSFKRPKGNRYSFKLVVTLSDGEVISRTVTYTGCASSKPKLKVLHRARRARRRTSRR